jgi:hypothetical protein
VFLALTVTTITHLATLKDVISRPAFKRLPAGHPQSQERLSQAAAGGGGGGGAPQQDQAVIAQIQQMLATEQQNPGYGNRSRVCRQ